MPKLTIQKTKVTGGTLELTGEELAILFFLTGQVTGAGPARKLVDALYAALRDQLGNYLPEWLKGPGLRVDGISPDSLECTR